MSSDRIKISKMNKYFDIKVDFVLPTYVRLSL